MNFDANRIFTLDSNKSYYLYRTIGKYIQMTNLDAAIARQKSVDYKMITAETAKHGLNVQVRVGIRGQLKGYYEKGRITPAMTQYRKHSLLPTRIIVWNAMIQGNTGNHCPLTSPKEHFTIRNR